MPFAKIDEVPVYPGCEDLETNEERKKCFAEHIQKFVQANFNTNIAKENGLNGRQRIQVVFKIDQNGNVVDIKARGPHPALEKEIKQVIASLPKMTPGKNKGKAVIVPYALPVVFEVTPEKKPEQN